MEQRARLGEYPLPRPEGPRPEGPRPEAPRVVGPGRVERRYLERLSDLELALKRETGRSSGLARELETSRLLERGSHRLLDRLERLAGEERAARAALEQREKRLILCLGGLQRENELLRRQLALAEPRAPRAVAEGADAPAGGRSPIGAGRRQRPRGTRSSAPGWLARFLRR